MQIITESSIDKNGLKRNLDAQLDGNLDGSFSGYFQLQITAWCRCCRLCWLTIPLNIIEYQFDHDFEPWKLKGIVRVNSFAFLSTDVVIGRPALMLMMLLRGGSFQLQI